MTKNITNYELINDKTKVRFSLPTVWRRPPVKQLTIRVVPRYCPMGLTPESEVQSEETEKEKKTFSDGARELEVMSESEDEEPEGYSLLDDEEEWQLLDEFARPLPDVKSVSITYATLTKMDAPFRAGSGSGGSLEKLQAACEQDLQVIFKDDYLVLAWHNPMDFWGRESYCRIGSSAELEKVLDVLRLQHLVEPSDDPVVFLYLVCAVPLLYLEKC